MGFLARQILSHVCQLRPSRLPSFAKDLVKIKSKATRKRVKEAIEGVEKSQTPQNIPNLKKLRGGHNYYRIKVGLTIKDDLVVFIRCLDRKEIYRFFP